ncbi:MAG: hypothetical protein DMG02_31360 [Acidobacteria bacterium]|nr:MAG: hypothetical protein DMG02_31360 [Acidobacteriota bacterium]PYR11760.1 MAG: hypothetical protein DMF99_06790 [Acidobacteriota bacterium]
MRAHIAEQGRDLLSAIDERVRDLAIGVGILLSELRLNTSQIRTCAEPVLGIGKASSDCRRATRSTTR